MRVPPGPQPVDPRPAVGGPDSRLRVPPAHAGSLIANRAHRVGLAVRHRLKAVLAPYPAKRPDVVAPADLALHFGAVGVNHPIIGDVLAQVAFAAHRPDESALVPLQRLHIRGVEEDHPLGLQARGLFGHRSVFQQDGAIDAERNAPGHRGPSGRFRKRGRHRAGQAGIAQLLKRRVALERDRREIGAGWSILDHDSAFRGCTERGHRRRG